MLTTLLHVTGARRPERGDRRGAARLRAPPGPLLLSHLPPPCVLPPPTHTRIHTHTHAHTHTHTHKPQTLDLKPYALHQKLLIYPIPYTLHPTPYTSPTHGALHPKTYTLHPNPCLHLDLCTLRLTPYDRLWEGYRQSRRCSRDTYPESCITKCTSIRR